MSANWWNDPVIQAAGLCSLMAIGFIGSISLWVSVKLDARASRKYFENFRVETEATISELKRRVEELGNVSAPEPVSSVGLTVRGLNLTNRTKALRMHGRGESVASIAGSLGVQQEEIELLLKLDRLLEVSVT